MLSTKEFDDLSNLIIEYRPRLFRMALGILRNQTDAEDAVSETTCKIFANYYQLKDKKKFYPWAMRILINESYAIAKKRKKYSYLDQDMIGDSVIDKVFDTLILWDAVNKLNEKYRVVTILFYYENMSIKDISKILCIPTGTVNSRLNRSRNLLKQYFMNEEVCQYERV